MPFHLPAEEIERCGCPVSLRCIQGHDALELFFNCRPPQDLVAFPAQVTAIYRAILEVLDAYGGDLDTIVSETVFMRDIPGNVQDFRANRRQVLESASAGENIERAALAVEQPPIDADCVLEVQIWAIVPAQPAQLDTITTIPTCACEECAITHGRRIALPGDTRLYAGGLYGKGDGAYQQTAAMFEAAENLLQAAGMEFHDVMRTWIYLREMDRDYADFNRARRQFFQARGIDPIPASTGIGAGLVAAEHDICLCIYAVQAANTVQREVMTTPTLNEAPVYGSDFSRGMRVNESNRTALLVSGTASLDESGSTVHVGDFDAQVDRMLVNVRALLEGQGAGFKDVVSAITYVKHAEDASKLRQAFRDAGYTGFPNAVVEAEVCRPELLCETELLALLAVGDG